MLYSKLISLLSTPKDLKSTLNDIISSDRNKILEIHRDYYDGIHWAVDKGGQANSTRSGKLIWGKSFNYQGSESDKLGRSGGKGNKISFHEGQLQTHNYIKLFTNTYQDFVLGQGDDNIEIIYEETDEKPKNEKAVTEPENAPAPQGEEPKEKEDTKSEFLDKMWKDSTSFVKEEIARMVITTIALCETVWSEEEGYTVVIRDAQEFVPIYKDGKHIGSMRVYMISALDAKDLYQVDLGKKEEAVFADMFYPEEERYYNTKVVDGVVIDTVLMPDSLNFDPFTFVANLDLPFRDFDEDNLEDSEIFNWIDRNDALNSNETVEFVSNQYLAMPKITMDHDIMDKMGISMKDPAFKKALKEFQYFPGSVDSLPIKLQDGKTIPQSFYTGKDTIIQALFEDAGIPRFVFSGEGMINISAETVTLGMGMLVRKISQKRDQMIRLIKTASMKALKAQGLIDKDMDLRDLPISVNLPNVIGLNQEEFLEQLFIALDKNLITKEYATMEFMRSIGREDEAEDQIKALDSNSAELLEGVEARANEIKSEREVKTQVDEKKAKESETKRMEAEIKALA